MRDVRTVVAMVVAALLVLGGCDREGPTSRPAPPPGAEKGDGSLLPVGPEGASHKRLPSPFSPLIQVAARIEPTSTVEGFPKTLVVELSLVPDQDLYWNNEGPPPELTLAAPEGVRLAQQDVVIPNTQVPYDLAPRSARVGLAEDASADASWTLGVTLKAYVCLKQTGACLIAEESHQVTPTRASAGP